VQLPAVSNSNARAVATSSLAAGFAQGLPVVAVGLTDGGVQIYDVSQPSQPRLAATWTGMAVTGSQTPVTALALDPVGSGMLSVGVVSRGNLGYVLAVQRAGTVGPVTTWSVTGGTPSAYNGVLATTFGTKETTPTAGVVPVVAYGLNDGTVRLVDPTP